MKDLISAKQARAILGVTEDKFQYMVRTEQVTKIIKPGRKYGEYSRKEIEALAAATTGFVQQYLEDIKIEVFRVARPEDAQAMYELGERAMKLSGGQGIPPEKLIPFLTMPNSEIGHVLYRNKKLAGYFTIVPMHHEDVIKRMNNETTISQIKPEQLASFEPGEKIDCFVWEIISDPENKHVSAYLIGKVLTFFHNLGKRGVDIDSIYAVATSLEGINMCRKVGMKLMNLPSVKPDFMPFELKVQEQKYWLNKNYIQAIKSYKKRQQQMQSSTNAPVKRDND